MSQFLYTVNCKQFIALTFSVVFMCLCAIKHYSFILLVLNIHRESKKGATLTMAITLSVICKILSLLQRELNFKQNSYYVTHYTLSMLLHYLEKLKNQKFALCMRVNMFEV